MISKDDLYYRWLVLSMLVGCQLVLSIVSFGWGPLAPFLKKIMSLSSAQVGMIGSTFYFTATLSAFPSGIAIDRYGVKKGILCWLGLTGLPLFFVGLVSDSYAFFLIMVAISGFGYGMGNPVAAKEVYIWFDPKARGTAIGIRQSAVTGGAALSGIFLVYLSQRFGPFTALRIVSLMIMAMMVAALFLYQDPKDSRADNTTEESNDKRSMKSGLRNFLTNRAFFSISIIMAILGLAQGVVVTFFVLYANEKLGYSRMAAGSLISLAMLSGAAGRLLWGIVSDRLFHAGRKPVLIIITGLTTVSAALLAIWVDAWPHWLFLLLVIATGLSSAGWNAIALVLVTEISPGNKTATSVGLASTIGWAGLFLGPIGFGILVDHFGYSYAWISLAVFCFFSFILSFLMPVSTQDPIKTRNG